MFVNEEALVLLRKIDRWLEMLAKAQLAPVLSSELSDPRMSALYKLTGTHGQREIKKKLKMSANTISDAWNRWERQGLIIKEGRDYKKVL